MCAHHTSLVDLWAGQQLPEALAAGVRLQEEGSRDVERHREERQHLGSTHFPESSGIPDVVIASVAVLFLWKMRISFFCRDQVSTLSTALNTSKYRKVHRLLELHFTKNLPIEYEVAVGKTYGTLHSSDS